MTTLIIGSNGSGKSLYAENLAAGYASSALYYIATMVPYGEEGRIRVEKHRKQRRSKGFITIEEPFSVSTVTIPPDTVVLLEDVSNLLGNTLFDGSGTGNEDSVFMDIAAMLAKCATAVIVSIDGLAVSREYGGETIAYIEALNRLNNRLRDFADTVVLMDKGKPIFIKGGADALD